MQLGACFVGNHNDVPPQALAVIDGEEVEENLDDLEDSGEGEGGESITSVRMHAVCAQAATHQYI